MNESTKKQKSDDFLSVLYIGTSPKGKAGIAAVIREYQSFLGCSFYYVCTHQDGRTLRKLWLFFTAILKTLYWCSTRQIKVVHIHSSSHLSFYRKSCFVFIAKLFRKRVVLHLHGGLFVDFARRHQRYCQFVFNCSDLVITVSDYLRSESGAFLRHNNMHTVYNPIPIPQKVNAVLPSSKVQVLFFGTINENKGIFDVLNCLEAHQSYFRTRIHFHIGGVGHLVQQLEQRLFSTSLNEFVTYHGWIDGEKKVELLQKADIYLQPSYFESLGIAVLEAMSYRTAIIASNRGGLPEIVHHEETGLLIEPGSLYDLFNALKRLIDNQEERCSFAEQGGIFAEQMFITNVMEQLQGLYASLFQPRNRICP